MNDQSAASSRILLLGRDPQAMAVINDFAGLNGYSLVEAGDGLEAARFLKSEESPKIAVLDLGLMGMSEKEMRETMASIKGDYSPYLIMMTDKGGEALAAELYSPGAKDILSKPFDPDELYCRLEVGRRMAELQHKLRKAKAEVAELTLTDLLTQVPNRKTIMERLKTEMLRVSREDASLYIGIMDIDKFKSINDAYGSTIGDCVLIECVTRAVSVLRPYDAIGRIGGEEFLLIIPFKEESDPFPVFERVRKAVGRQSVTEGKLSIPVTVSIGVARWDQWRSLDELVKKAEEALALAKETGRDKVEIS